MTEAERFQAQLDDISGRALEIGGAVAFVLGVLSGIVTTLSGLFLDHDPKAFPPAAFALAAGVYAGTLRQLAKNRAHGRLGVPLVLGFLTLPTLFFVVADVAVPDGAAQYFSSPFLHVYAMGLVFSGMWLRPRLSVAAGVYACVQVLVDYALMRATLQAHAHDDGHLLVESGLDISWLMKAAITAATGFIVAAIGTVARQLVVRVLAEEREKREVSKLFGDFVSADVRDKILRDRNALKSERRTMAVLFSDLRNFTTHSEHTDPSVLVDRLNRYFERMVAAVEREGGVVDKFIGDAVMATFGGVVPLANPSSSALRAARAMRAALADLNEQWLREGVAAFENGIGIHFGEVIEGPLGAPRRREYTVIGDVVNTASRVEGLTKEKARAILVTGAVYDALSADERAALDALGDAHVKGKAESVRIYGA